jgi:hypothetical protein
MIIKLLFLTLIPLIQCTIILKPPRMTTFQAGYIFVQGADIPASNYKNYASLLQNKLDWSLWVAILEFPINLPDPLQINSLMQKAFGDLKTQGFKYDQTTPVFFGAHSLGGIVVMDFLIENQKQLPFKFRYRLEFDSSTRILCL